MNLSFIVQNWEQHLAALTGASINMLGVDIISSVISGLIIFLLTSAVKLIVKHYWNKRVKK